MEKFINKVAHSIFVSNRGETDGLIIILPSKRAGTFFKKALADLSETPMWAPKIYSIEEWLEELSGYTVIDRTTLLFELFISYQKTFPKAEQDSFETFLKWAPTLLTDFNDIEGYLERPDMLFSYLDQAKKVEAWSPLGGKPSILVKNYLRFWELLGLLFIDFKHRLSCQNLAFQGMASRKASGSINQWLLEKKPAKGSICYIGFNAMNPCEEQIMRALISEGVAEVFWDVDSYYLNDKKQEAGKYFRQHMRWSEFENRPFSWLSSELKNPKEINVYGVPRGVAQAQLAGALVDKQKQGLQDVALVLADEKLLLPCLEFLPKGVNKLNVTMGSVLQNTHMYALFDALFQLHINKEKLSERGLTFYYKDLFKIWQHPAFQNSHISLALEKFKTTIKNQNIVFATKKTLLGSCEIEIKPWFEVLLNYNRSNPVGIIDTALSLIDLIKNITIGRGDNHSLDLEQLFAFARLFNKIKTLYEKYGFIKELKTLHHLFQQSSQHESLSFVGEPLSGLQLMGLLETRTLDFEHVILLSANEGVLPEGKTDNSFIPFDIRNDFGLPTYIDRDAIFAYHFYRLAQRCKSLSLVYNTETNAFGSGEKSRFITQLENELVPKYSKDIIFKDQVLSHPIQRIKNQGLVIIKNTDIQSRLKGFAKESGFSPSSLNTYKNCPLQFYYEKILRIKEPSDIKETIEANTLGTVVHRALEDLYSPFLDLVLSENDLRSMLAKTPSKLKELFKQEFKNGNFNKGKNLLIFSVAEQFITSFIKRERQLVSEGNKIIVKGLEVALKTSINIKGINFPVFINGNVDRIDSFNGVLRIIDYKTGKVDLNELHSDDIEKLIREKKLHKGFQLFLYAWLYQKTFNYKDPFLAGVISFRSLKKGFLSAGFKTGTKVNPFFNPDIISVFEEGFKNLIKDVFNKNIHFHHNDRKEPCRFCDPEMFR